jgi:hypothetical protein
MFNKAEMSNSNDVIEAGSGFSITQKQEEQTVEIRNIGDSDCERLRQEFLLT